MKPAVSILLPIYNGERFLVEQVESILAQNHSDFELLIADDGSTDRSAAIAADFAKRDRRIHILPTTGNQGQKRRLYQLHLTSRAALIAVSDQDDIWDVEKLSRLVDAIGGFSLAYGRSELIDRDGNSLNRRLIEMFGHAPRPGDKLDILFRPKVSGHAMLVRRECVSEFAFGRFQPFDWLVALDALFAGGITYVDEAVVYHRLHDRNQMNGRVAGRAEGWARLRPIRMYQEMQGTRRRRFAFVARLEHLGHSPVVDKVIRDSFMRLGNLCQSAWFEPGVARPFSNPRLREAILDVLQPLAGSSADWKFVAGHVAALTRAQFHPHTMYQSAKRLFWY